MADRLAELLRQRALLQEHLAWLDREIAKASNSASPALTAPPTPDPQAPPRLAPSIPAPPITVRRLPLAASAPVIAPAADARATNADEILEQYRVAPAALQTDIRKGCLLYFIGALVFVGVVVAGLYLAFRK